MKPERIKKIRRRLRWTQKKLAFVVGVSVRTYQYWEVKGCKADSPASKMLATLE